MYPRRIVMQKWTMLEVCFSVVFLLHPQKYSGRNREYKGQEREILFQKNAALPQLSWFQFWLEDVQNRLIVYHVSPIDSLAGVNLFPYCSSPKPQRSFAKKEARSNQGELFPSSIHLSSSQFLRIGLKCFLLVAFLKSQRALTETHLSFYLLICVF